MDLNDTRFLPREPLDDHLAERQAELATIAAELKQELFGIDDVIDRVIDAVRAWYVMPQLIARPVIVCLWGLTGTGKTQLTRLLVQKLGFYDRYVEVQMDGFSNGAGWYTPDSISGMLGESGIDEGEPGVLLLDEFQRYRTIDNRRQDIKVARYQDVWALLSDGRLSPALSFLRDLEYRTASAQFELDERQSDADDTDSTPAPSADAATAAPAPAKPRPRKFKLGAWEARELQRTLKLNVPLTELMAWSPEQVQAEVEAFRADPARWQTDYSKLLIIVTGNLDEMYEDLAERVEDCDTDADVFHAMSQRLSVIDVKKALGSRFRPEQVARLGNQHVIYPSLSRSAYQRLIARTCAQYVDEVAVRSGLRIDVAQPVLDEIYANGVFPAQGTRPVFSTVHGVLGGSLVRAALWAIERGAPPGAVLPLTLGDDRKHLCVRWGDAEQRLPVVFELEGLRERASLDFRTLLAVHEAGHGLVYAVLMGTAPQEVRINVASFNGGYASYAPQKAWSRRMLRDVICVSLAGRAAEALVFGPDATTTGAEADRKQATANAIAYVRHHGFGSRVSRTDVTVEKDDDLNTDVGPTNAEAEALMSAEAERATALLCTHGNAFRALVQQLLATGTVPAAEFAKVTGIAVTAAAPHAPSGPEPWHARWSAFVGDSA